MTHCFWKKSVYNYLQLAALNRRFSIQQEDWSDYTLVLREGAAEPSALPLSLCVVELAGAGDALGALDIGLVNAYSQTHPFFCWLLREREKLERDVPAVYRGILKTMVLDDKEEVIRQELNAALERLSRFPGDPFDTKSVPRLTEADFILPVAVLYCTCRDSARKDKGHDCLSRGISTD